VNELLKTLKTTALEIADSKKWMGSIVGFACVLLLRLAGKLNLGLSPDEAREISEKLVYLVLVAVGGQAIVDHGAGKAPADAGTPADSTRVSDPGPVKLNEGRVEVASPLAGTGAEPRTATPPEAKTS
jgi:hypothetical protein